MESRAFAGCAGGSWVSRMTTKSKNSSPELPSTLSCACEEIVAEGDWASLIEGVGGVWAEG